MKIYQYDLRDENEEILSVKRIEKRKSLLVEYYRIVFQDEGWITVGEVSLCYEWWTGMRQVFYYSLYPLNERMIKTIRKIAIG